MLFDTVMTIYEAATMAHDAYKRVSTLIFGDKKEQYLQQIATDMKDMKLHIERLSDTILYAVNLDGVRATGQSQQNYINELREIRPLLEPMQRALKQPILSSAMISAPRSIENKDPRALRNILRVIKPIDQVRVPLAKHGLVPVLSMPLDLSVNKKSKPDLPG